MDFSTSYQEIKNSVSIAITCAHCIVPNTQVVAKFSGQSNGIIGQVIQIDQQKDIAIVLFGNSIGPGVAIKDSSTVQVRARSICSRFSK